MRVISGIVGRLCRISFSLNFARSWFSISDASEFTSRQFSQRAFDESLEKLPKLR